MASRRRHRTAHLLLCVFVLKSGIEGHVPDVEVVRGLAAKLASEKKYEKNEKKKEKKRRERKQKDKNKEIKNKEKKRRERTKGKQR